MTSLVFFPHSARSAASSSGVHLVRFLTGLLHQQLLFSKLHNLHMESLQILQLLRFMSCSHMEPPPHVTHNVCRMPCSQPLQILQLPRSLPCSQLGQEEKRGGEERRHEKTKQRKKLVKNCQSINQKNKWVLKRIVVHTLDSCFPPTL